MAAEVSTRRRERSSGPSAGVSPPTRDRSLAAVLWYQTVRYSAATLLAAAGGLRATGVKHLPPSGGVLLVSNHLSHLDVFVLGLPLPRPLNYVARSTLFFPPLGAMIRSVGAFPIQREGMGASGLKETLRRIRIGGVVTLFPEGTRSPDGELGLLKPGVGILAARARVPILPAAVAGTFEAWPRTRGFPRPHPVCVHYGPPIPPEEFIHSPPEAIAALIRARILDCQQEARETVRRLLPSPP